MCVKITLCRTKSTDQNVPYDQTGRLVQWKSSCLIQEKKREKKTRRKCKQETREEEERRAVPPAAL